VRRREFLYLSLSPLLLGQQGRSQYPPVMPGVSKEAVYKRVDGTQLKLYIYFPPGHKPSDRRPTIVFFFGGGWRSGTPRQFAPHCQYFASRGMVAIAADYRVWDRHKASIAQCVEDAKSAIRWVRTHARELGADPNRIVAAGGSAGGHLAAATAILKDLEGPGEDTSISSTPNALILFNPALILAPLEGETVPPGAVAKLAERAGAPLVQLSPYHHIRPGLPPSIIFHGKQDTTVPYRTVELFCEGMRQLGNRCELEGYEGARHGFFNYGRGSGQAFYDTLRKADQFLISLGYLSGEPAVESFQFQERQ